MKAVMATGSPRFRNASVQSSTSIIDSRIVLLLLIWIGWWGQGVESQSSIVSTVSSTALSSLELSALYDLYNATSGPSWIYHGNETAWNFSQPSPDPCGQQWAGVNCSCSAVCTVARLELMEMNLDGTLPSTLSNLSSLIMLDVTHNNVSGTIPASLAEISTLTYLYLVRNKLTGCIPSSLFNHTGLFELYLITNLLNCRLSPEIAGMTSLRRLEIGNNSFYGTLPTDIEHMTNLHMFNVESNNFTGTIPPGLGRLSNLTMLSLEMNHFQGTLPEFLCNLTQLSVLWLGSNEFEGSIPKCIGNLTRLQSLDLIKNSLYGRLPPSLGKCSELEELQLSMNSLTGPIPVSDWSNLTKMFEFSIDNNLLTGSLFTASLPKVVEYDLAGNMLWGELSSFNFSQFPDLEFFSMAHNLIYGTVPSTVALAPKLTFFVVGTNFLTGTMPMELGQLPEMAQLYLPTNALHGSIPASFAMLKQMSQLFLDENLLSGSVTHGITNIGQLETFYLYANLLTGPIVDFFNASTPVFQMRNVDLSHNRFTGSLPRALTQSRLIHLSSFAAVSNCLEGDIPSTICSLPELTSLALDGVSTSESCRSYIFPHLKSMMRAFELKTRMGGSIPACLFNMSMLQSLHLSGNGLTGSLPTDLHISPSLVDIVLSHNQLTGSIPEAIQHHVLQNLDLGYNHFGGTLAPDFAVGPGNYSTVVLRMNELSGEIPLSLIRAENVDILNGNIFFCSALDEDLPPSDPSAARYSCGSNDINRSMFLWCGVIGSVVLGASLVTYLYTRKYVSAPAFQSLAAMVKVWKEGYEALDQEMRCSDHQLALFVHWLRQTRKLFLWLSGFALLVLLPVYCALSSNAHVYEHTYGWVVSALLLSGSTAAWTLTAVFCLTLACVVAAFYLLVGPLSIYLTGSSKLTAQSRMTMTSIVTSNATATVATDRGRESICIAILSIINIIAMIVMDIEYVYVFIQGSTTVVIIVQLLVAVLKIFWNEKVLWWVLRRCKERLLTRPQDQTQYSDRQVMAIVVNVLLNSIIAPCLAVAGVTSSCFYHALVAANSVIDTFTIYQCGVLVNVKDGPDICLNLRPYAQYTEYYPPFQYSYLCSSTISINFTPIYVYMYLILGLIMPLMKLVVRFWAQQSAPVRAQDGQEEQLGMGQWMQALIAMASKQLRPLSQRDASTLHASRHVFFFREKLLVRIATALGVMLSFGVMYPPLAVVVGLACWSFMVTEQVLVGITWKEALLMPNVGFYRQTLHNECQGLLLLFRHCAALVLPFGVVIQAYVVYDVMGYAHGWRRAVAPLLVVLLFPVVCGGGLWLMSTALHQHILPRDDSVDSISKTSSTDTLADRSDRSMSVIELTGASLMEHSVSNPIHAAAEADPSDEGDVTMRN